MPFPRRPSGEQPITTIRWQRRQMAQMEQTIVRISRVNESNERRISAQDVELSDAAERERILIDQIERGADQYGALLAAHQKDSMRLAYLEGYFYAKSTEANPRSSAGDTHALQDGAQAPEGMRSETVASGDGAPPRSKIRGIRPGYSAYPDRRPMAESEIGEAK